MCLYSRIHRYSPTLRRPREVVLQLAHRHPLRYRRLFELIFQEIRLQLILLLRQLVLSLNRIRIVIRRHHHFLLLNCFYQDTKSFSMRRRLCVLEIVISCKSPVRETSMQNILCFNALQGCNPLRWLMQLSYHLQGHWFRCEFFPLLRLRLLWLLSCTYSSFKWEVLLRQYRLLPSLFVFLQQLGGSSCYIFNSLSMRFDLLLRLHYFLRNRLLKRHWRFLRHGAWRARTRGSRHWQELILICKLGHYNSWT